MQQPQLVITDESGRLKAFSLPLGSVVVGRSDAADIAVGPGNVSRRHAQLTWDGSALRIADLNSTNGTSVNGARVVRPTDLRHGDRIQLGTVEGYVTMPTRGEHNKGPALTQEPVEPQPRLRSPPGRSANSVFISYASSDRPRAQVFTDYLRDNGWNVLLDQDFLQPGEVWNHVIAEQLATCSAVLVLVSPASAGSEWVNKELVAAVNAGRPILPVVIDSFNIGETHRRLAILGDRQWLTLDNPLGQLDTDELDMVAHHLGRLAAGVRPNRTVTSRERLGLFIMSAGILGIVATMGWYFTGFVRLGRYFLEITRADVEFGSDDPFTEVDRASDVFVEELTGLFVAFPFLFVALVMAVAGFVIRRNARKRRLMGW